MMRSDLPPLLALGLLTVTGALVPDSSFAQPVEPGREGELGRLLKPEDGARVCFSRVYDAKHLEAHPAQRVTRMDFRLTYYIHEPDAYFPKGQRNYYFQLQAQLRGATSRRPLSATGECRPDRDGIWCGVECDGGGVRIKRRDGGRLIVDLESTGRIRMTEGCGEDAEDGVDLLPGQDDKTFLLSGVSEGQCPTYEGW